MVTIEVSSEETAGDCDGSYTLTRRSATDDAGNSTSATRRSLLRTRDSWVSVPADYTSWCSDAMP